MNHPFDSSLIQIDMHKIISYHQKFWYKIKLNGSIRLTYFTIWVRITAYSYTTRASTIKRINFKKVQPSWLIAINWSCYLSSTAGNTLKKNKETCLSKYERHFQKIWIGTAIFFITFPCHSNVEHSKYCSISWWTVII